MLTAFSKETPLNTDQGRKRSYDCSLKTMSDARLPAANLPCGSGRIALKTPDKNPLTSVACLHECHSRWRGFC
jgi:hypothetical protein